MNTRILRRCDDRHVKIIGIKKTDCIVFMQVARLVRWIIIFMGCECSSVSC